MLHVMSVNVCVQHFNLYKLPKSKLTNANILCLVQFCSGQNKLVQLLIRSRYNVVTCEASRFDSSSNRASDSGFDSY